VGKLQINGLPLLVMNVIGACAVLISLLYSFNLSPFSWKYLVLIVFTD